MKIKTEHLEYLDGLRDSGETNMFNARPYLIAEFGMGHGEAKEVLSHWMKTYSKRMAAKERAAARRKEAPTDTGADGED